MNAIEDAIRDIARGKMIIVVDDDNRENEGDLVVAAEHATAATINFMARYGRGLICVPMEGSRLRELGLDPMVARNDDAHGTAFSVSTDWAGASTGISAAERAETIRALVSPATRPTDLRRPGHVFPLAARSGGVLERRGHTEAAVDLARLAGLPAAGVICEIMNDDGTMARLPDLERLAVEWGLCVVSVADLVRYRRARERIVERVADTVLPTRKGVFRMVGYRETIGGREHVALILGDVSNGPAPLCRVHSECLTGDAFGSLRCDCGEQYEAAMGLIAEEGRGVLVYLRQEGRGIGLIEKLRAYELQDAGADTVDANLRLGHPADARDYAAGAAILADLGVGAVRLMTNNPDKVAGLEERGIAVVERVPIVVEPNDANRAYLLTKEKRMGHRLNAEPIYQGRRS
ncbi:MAG TPA: bifunctional 3,4-dihydroxy-2-butanone-4-phosphate synthase/GTP cyclohydrolase II [Treponemataceae bacterium]|nr:bifunctional 3,4-dihydroxy-2-butanone-4-phosphate synthase/GTP cyclohydrolase II [Treponemataceae bacterium]